MSAEMPTRLGRARGRAGLFLLIGIGVFVGAVLQAGLLEPYLQRTATLRVLLPERGLAGLGPGAEVRLFGSPIGEVREVVISPDEPFYAETAIDEAMREFIRQDSTVFVRLQFGVAGAAFLDITRGRGAPLDWDFAVLEAQVEQAPTEGVGALIEEARERIFPLVDEATRTLRLAGDLVTTLTVESGPLHQTLEQTSLLTARLAAGEGTVGRLLTDDTLLRELERAVAQLNVQVAALSPLLADLGQAGGSVVRITDNVAAGTETLPVLLATLEATLRSVDTVLQATSGAMPSFEAAAEDAGRSMEALPEVLRRTSQTLAQLEELLDGLRRSWLVGGGGAGAAGSAPTAVDVRP